MRIAAFDFDGTITSKDSLLEFIKFTWGGLKFYSGVLFFSPVLILMKLKLYPNWKAKQRFFSYFFKGVSLEQFNKWGEDFVPVIDEMVRPKAREAIKEHLAAGDTVLIISASVFNWIMPWAEKNGIKTVLATMVETDNHDIMTGKFTSRNCYGNEKVIRLLEKYPNREEYELISYGDSKGDKPLLDFSDAGHYKPF